MFSSWARHQKARVLLVYRWILRSRGVLLRGSLCWAIGLAVYFMSEGQNYDRRFKVRGPQPLNQEIVLIDITDSDWMRVNGQARNLLRPLKEFSTQSDQFYWSPRLWKRILDRLLEADPQAVVVSFFFQAENQRTARRFQSVDLFSDPRVIWSADVQNEGRIVTPPLPVQARGQVGLNQIPIDDDGSVRRINLFEDFSIKHITLSAAKKSGVTLGNLNLPSSEDRDSRLINYRGKRGSFKSFSIGQLMNGYISEQALKDKIIIIGSVDNPAHLFMTPLGAMPRSEILANVIDNITENRFVGQMGTGSVSLILLGILVTAIWVMFSYPQSVAFVFLFWLGTGYTALSLWTFDAFFYWTPIQAPLIQLSITYILFLGYQLTLKENQTWRLEQEKHYLKEVEQLKNNFVSLFSHDLKTPIAKIQGICDRLLVQYPDEKFTADIMALRSESTELHRYIQSILKMSRVESRDFQLMKEASDINEIIENVVAQMTPLAIAKEIQISVDLEPMFLVEFDPTLMHEVLLNLVENAVKYTPAGGSVLVRSREFEGQLQVEVEDSGIGIDADEQQKIFDKFFRSKSQTLSTKGSGLGLYLVRYFIELHGGRVYLESQPGTGTKMGFVLPTDQPADELIEAAGSTKHEVTA